jgi:hypothetical protein
VSPDIEAIIASVGAAVPPKIDKAELLSDLKGTVSLYRHSVGLRNEPAKRAQRLAKVIKAARYLQSELAGDPRFWSTLLELERVCQLGPYDLRLPNMLGYKKVSAFDNLIGFMLAETFEKHFKLKSGYSKDRIDGTVSGPFIEFAETVLDQFKIEIEGKLKRGSRPYSRRAIADAYTKGSHR